jgi:hypothetical protein
MGNRFLHCCVLVLVVALASGGTELAAQCDSLYGDRKWDFEGEAEASSVLGFVGDLFTPQLVKDTRRIRNYVRDPRFAELLKVCGDWRAADAIYMKSLVISEYSIGRALFLSMMATLEHQQVEVDMPVVGSMTMPLTFEPDSQFASRLRNLPTRIYSDTPAAPDGDRDKLQHFFGSAYLAHASESPEIARSTGNVIEWGEAKYVVGGVSDPRDKRANKQGETFGHDLLFVRNLLPSDYLRLPVDDR